MGDEIQTVVLDLPTTAPSNWDDFEKLIHHACYNELRIAPEEHPLLITETSFANPTVREKLTQVLFETFNVPGLAIFPSSYLALSSFGIETGISIHSGETGTEIVPIHNGKLLRDIALDYPVSGTHLTGYLINVLGDSSSSIVSIAKDMKKKCFTSQNPGTQAPIKLEYEMPDGTFVNLDDASWKCVESMFYPEYISIAHPPLALTILNVISQCPADIQNTMLKNIVITGGNVSFNGFGKRLQKDITLLLSDIPNPPEVKVFSADEPKYQTWIGGSIVGSLSTFYETSCLSKDRYDEVGPSGIHEFCL